MAHRISINDGLTVDTGQPTRDELGRLAQEGFRSVINLRTAGEPNQVLSPDAEGDVVREAGLAYAHIPVNSANPRSEQVDEFTAKLAELPGPVLVHCASGKRSGAFAMLQFAKEKGLSGDEAIAQSQTLGLDWNNPEIDSFVRRSLDQRMQIRRRSRVT